MVACADGFVGLQVDGLDHVLGRASAWLRARLQLVLLVGARQLDLELADADDVAVLIQHRATAGTLGEIGGDGHEGFHTAGSAPECMARYIAGGEQEKAIVGMAHHEDWRTGRRGFASEGQGREVHAFGQVELQDGEVIHRLVGEHFADGENAAIAGEGAEAPGTLVLGHMEAGEAHPGSDHEPAAGDVEADLRLFRVLGEFTQHERRRFRPRGNGRTSELFGGSIGELQAADVALEAERVHPLFRVELAALCFEVELDLTIVERLAAYGRAWLEEFLLGGLGLGLCRGCGGAGGLCVHRQATDSDGRGDEEGG